MAFEFDEIGEVFEDTGKSVKGFFKKNKEIILIGGGALVLMLLLTKDNKATGEEYVVAESVEGYPDVAENSEIILGSIADKYIGLSGQLSEHDSNMSQEFDNTNSIIKDMQGDNSLYIEKEQSTNNSLGTILGGITGTAGEKTTSSAVAEDKKVIAEKILKDPSYYQNGETPQSAYRNFYNMVTGGGTSKREYYEDGTSALVYEPNVKQGTDRDGDGGISVSYNAKGEMVSTEFNEHKTVHTDSDGKIYVSTIGEDAKRKETIVYDSAKNLPTYTGIDKDNYPTQYTVIK